MPTERSLRRIEAPFTTSPPSYRRSPAHHPPISHRHPGGEVDGDEADEDKDPQFFTPSTSSSDTSSTSSSKRKSARPYSSSTTRSNSSSSITDEQQGVPRNVQKQLLQDIEGTGGGISAFFFNDTGVYALKHLCDGREDIYGLPSSNQRRQIQNKVSRWKSLSEDKYYQLLAEYGVQPAVDPPQLPRQQAAAPTTTRTSMTPMIRGGGAPKRGDDDVDYHARIDIDIENPERNREVKIIPFVNVVQDGVLHNGFDIAIDAIDMRDYVQDMYKAELISANEILLKMPSASHAWLNEPRTANCPRTQEAYEVARNSILLSDDRKIKLLLLRFPGSITLSNQHYSPQSMNGEIECDFAMKDTSFTFDGKNLKSVVTTVFWKVSVVEEQQRIVKQSTNSGKKKGAAKLSKYLSGSVTRGAASAAKSPAPGPALRPPPAQQHQVDNAMDIERNEAALKRKKNSQHIQQQGAQPKSSLMLAVEAAKQQAEAHEQADELNMLGEIDTVASILRGGGDVYDDDDFGDLEGDEDL